MLKSDLVALLVNKRQLSADQAEQAVDAVPGVNYIHPSATITSPHRAHCLMPSFRS